MDLVLAKTRYKHKAAHIQLERQDIVLFLLFFAHY